MTRARYLDEHDAFGLEILDGEDMSADRLKDALLQMPFLVSKKLVIIRGVFAGKLLVESLQDILEQQVPDEIDVVLCDDKPDKRTKLFKYLDKNTAREQFQLLDIVRLAVWVRQYAVEQGCELSDQLVRQLVERSGTDQYRLSHDIEVLALQQQPITTRTIEELVQPTLNSTVFQLLEVAFVGNSHRALALCNELFTQKIAPSEIVAMIGWQLHIFALIKTAGTHSPTDIAKLGRVHPFVVSRSMSTAKRMSTAQLKELVSRALAADLAIKTSSGSAEDVLRVLILELSEIISS